MTSTEASQFKSSVSQLQASLAPGSLFFNYMQSWLADIDAFSANSSQTSDVSGDVPVGLIASTVANLPASPTSGQEAIATDGSSPVVGSTVSGGGSTRVMVKWNGSNWLVE